MKKKTVSIVIAAAALTLLAGCGSNTASGAGESASAETEAAAETETEEATKTDEETDPAFTEGGEAESTGTVDLSNADGLLKQVLDKGTLVAGMEGNWAPWSYHDLDTNEVIGYDADTARAIGEKLGVEVQIVEAPWESLFAGLDDGRYDIVINGVEVTDERSEKYDFSEPYAYIHTALVVRKDNEEIKSFDDLKGKKTVNSIGSTYMELAESYGASAAGVSTLNDTIQNVIDGRADATLNADVSIYDYLNQQPDANIKIVATTEDASHVAIPIRKGDETASFEKAVNAAIEELKADGTLAELSEKYFGSDVTKE
ncbi:MAG: transporter substrate-binding domain-containing protein [Lachnospiraceae bacterium]|nr:transporter substrate-binding domain-containing protein [Bacillota bacterium]MDY2948318.1 transporter substrate-binding domain-containing protein [Lachnospiraceae bacterium]CCX64572.1 bacterial extracellular solute-binding protein family 3 [Firmicutes bacterium CAG:791]